MLLIGRAARETGFNQSKVLPRSRWSHVISMAGISALGPRTSFLGETGGFVAKCGKQFSHAGLGIYPKVYLRFNYYVSLFLGFVFFLLLFLSLRFLFGFSNSTRNIQMQFCWFTTRFFILWDIFVSCTSYCDIFNTVVERVLFVPIYELEKKDT